MAAGLGGACALAEARPGGEGTLAAPITGSLTDASGGTGSFAGTASITSFLNQNGNLVPVGSISGKLTDSTCLATCSARSPTCSTAAGPWIS